MREVIDGIAGLLGFALAIVGFFYVGLFGWFVIQAVWFGEPMRHVWLQSCEADHYSGMWWFICG